MKVITLSKTFPAYHPRAGEQTGFADAFLSGRKIHTIRENKNGYYKDGDILSVRQWSGKPYASKQVVLRDGAKIGVVPVKLFFHAGGGVSIFVSHGLLPANTVSRLDGLSTPDFIAWFNPHGLPDLTLNYSLIHFTDFRYE